MKKNCYLKVIPWGRNNNFLQRTLLKPHSLEILLSIGFNTPLQIFKTGKWTTFQNMLIFP